MPALSSCLAALLAARSRCFGVRNVRTGSVSSRGVNRSDHRVKASTEVNHLPPTRIASSLMRFPSGPGMPCVIHRNTQEDDTGLPRRPGGSRLAASYKPISVSERSFVGHEFMFLSPVVEASIRKLKTVYGSSGILKKARTVSFRYEPVRSRNNGYRKCVNLWGIERLSV
jgi:hypothetical protein